MNSTFCILGRYLVGGIEGGRGGRGGGVGEEVKKQTLNEQMLRNRRGCGGEQRM